MELDQEQGIESDGSVAVTTCTSLRVVWVVQQPLVGGVGSSFSPETVKFDKTSLHFHETTAGGSFRNWIGYVRIKANEKRHDCFA